MIAWLGTAWTWAKTHKQLAIPIAVGVACFFAGTRYAQQPSVKETVAEHAQASAAGQLEQSVHTGPEKITITDYAQDVGGWAPPVLPLGWNAEALRPGAAAGTPAQPSAEDDNLHWMSFCRPIVVPGEDRIVRQTVVERGPSVTDTRAATEEHRAEDKTMTLSVEASPATSFAIGAEDPFGAKRLHLEAGHELTRHLGARVGWTPANGLVHGWTMMGEFRF